MLVFILSGAHQTNPMTAVLVYSPDAYARIVQRVSWVALLWCAYVQGVKSVCV